MRRLLVAGNWKMHGSRSMTSELLSGILHELQLDGESALNYDILVCPATAYLAQAHNLLQNTPIFLGAQNVSASAQGAFTGEHSVSMLDDLGCSYVILGHSERRALFGESNEVVAEKFATCVSDASLTPILCVGETLEQKNSAQTEAVVGAQIDAVLSLLGVQAFSEALIAYEPVWAIGTGETARPEQAQAVHGFIRAKLADLDATIAENVQILYGGSVKADNAYDLFSQADIDGGLVGGAALSAESFADICQAAHKVTQQF